MRHLTRQEETVMDKALTCSVRVVRNKRCTWRPGDYGEYNTSCKNAFVLNDGTPSDNNMKFCCYCGGLLSATK